MDSSLPRPSSVVLSTAAPIHDRRQNVAKPRGRPVVVKPVASAPRQTAEFHYIPSAPLPATESLTPASISSLLTTNDGPPSPEPELPNPHHQPHYGSTPTLPSQTAAPSPPESKPTSLSQESIATFNRSVRRMRSELRIAGLTLEELEAERRRLDAIRPRFPDFEEVRKGGLSIRYVDVGRGAGDEPEGTSAEALSCHVEELSTPRTTSNSTVDMLIDDDPPVGQASTSEAQSAPSTQREASEGSPRTSTRRYIPRRRTNETDSPGSFMLTDMETTSQPIRVQKLTASPLGSTKSLSTSERTTEYSSVDLLSSRGQGSRGSALRNDSTNWSNDGDGDSPAGDDPRPSARKSTNKKGSYVTLSSTTVSAEDVIPLSGSHSQGMIHAKSAPFPAAKELRSDYLAYSSSDIFAEFSYERGGFAGGGDGVGKEGGRRSKTAPYRSEPLLDASREDRVAFGSGEMAGNLLKEAAGGGMVSAQPRNARKIQSAAAGYRSTSSLPRPSRGRSAKVSHVDTKVGALRPQTARSTPSLRMVVPKRAVQSARIGKDRIGASGVKGLDDEGKKKDRPWSAPKPWSDEKEQVSETAVAMIWGDVGKDKEGENEGGERMHDGRESAGIQSDENTEHQEDGRKILRTSKRPQHVRLQHHHPPPRLPYYHITTPEPVVTPPLFTTPITLPKPRQTHSPLPIQQHLQTNYHPIPIPQTRPHTAPLPSSIVNINLQYSHLKTHPQNHRPSTPCRCVAEHGEVRGALGGLVWVRNLALDGGDDVAVEDNSMRDGETEWELVPVFSKLKRTGSGKKREFLRSGSGRGGGAGVVGGGIVGRLGEDGVREDEEQWREWQRQDEKGDWIENNGEGHTDDLLARRSPIPPPIPPSPSPTPATKSIPPSDRKPPQTPPRTPTPHVTKSPYRALTPTAAPKTWEMSNRVVGFRGVLRVGVNGEVRNIDVAAKMQEEAQKRATVERSLWEDKDKVAKMYEEVFQALSVDDTQTSQPTTRAQTPRQPLHPTRVNVTQDVPPPLRPTTAPAHPQYLVATSSGWHCDGGPTPAVAPAAAHDAGPDILQTQPYRVEKLDLEIARRAYEIEGVCKVPGRAIRSAPVGGVWAGRVSSEGEGVVGVRVKMSKKGEVVVEEKNAQGGVMGSEIAWIGQASTLTAASKFSEVEQETLIADPEGDMTDSGNELRPSSASVKASEDDAGVDLAQKEGEEALSTAKRPHKKPRRKRRKRKIKKKQHEQQDVYHEQQVFYNNILPSLPTSSHVSSLASLPYISRRATLKSMASLGEDVIPVEEELEPVLTEEELAAIAAAEAARVAVEEKAAREWWCFPRPVEVYVDLVLKCMEKVERAVVLIQTLYRAHRVFLQFTRVRQIQKSKRNPVLAVKQLDKLDAAAEVAGNGEYLLSSSNPDPGDRDNIDGEGGSEMKHGYSTVSTTSSGRGRDLLLRSETDLLEEEELGLNPVLKRIKTVARRRLTPAKKLQLSQTQSKMWGMYHKWQKLFLVYYGDYVEELKKVDGSILDGETDTDIEAGRNGEDPSSLPTRKPSLLPSSTRRLSTLDSITRRTSIDPSRRGSVQPADASRRVSLAPRLGGDRRGSEMMRAGQKVKRGSMLAVVEKKNPIEEAVDGVRDHVCVKSLVRVLEVLEGVRDG
ncbi:hypothetical protein HDV00_012810 [Rhizophlyctis rosea]|nr:hypothetical protein HDV00_012810 [Rhizophlyctis rosea]